MINIANGMFRTLRAGCKLVSFGRVERHEIQGTPADVAVLCVVLMAWTVVHQLILSEGQVRFYEYGLSFSLGVLALSFGSFALVFGRLLQDRFGAFLAATISGTIVVLAAATPVYLALKPFHGLPFSETGPGGVSDWIWFVVLITLLAVCIRGYVRSARLFLSDRTRRTWLVGVGAFALTLMADLSLPRLPILYDPANPPSEESIVGWIGDQFTASQSAQSGNARPIFSASIERTYYRQPQLIEQQGRSLHPQRPGVVDLYFVGFAGWGGQNVFMREVIQVRELLNDRFDAWGRSAVLINNRDTIGLYPLANRSNLDLLLKEMRDAMDVEEDILMLFLTSHGDVSRLSVSFGSFSFDDIRPDDLKSLLDRYGFQNRVLVISSCYSGSFVPDLKDARTMVITAAAADRRSFGCSNSRSWTYFGDAFFNHALRDQLSFEDAFVMARKLVHEWELQEELTPSRPQMHAGKEISSVLSRFVSRLSRRQVTPPDEGHASLRP